MSEGDPPMYSLCLIIPKSDKETITRLYKAVEAAKEIGKKQLWGGVIPEEIGNPIHDGNVGRPKTEAVSSLLYEKHLSREKMGEVVMQLSNRIRLHSSLFLYSRSAVLYSRTPYTLQ